MIKCKMQHKHQEAEYGLIELDRLPRQGEYLELKKGLTFPVFKVEEIIHTPYIPTWDCVIYINFSHFEKHKDTKDKEEAGEGK